MEPQCYISNVDVIGFECNVEIFWLIFYFSLGLLPEFQAFCPKNFGAGGAAAPLAPPPASYAYEYAFL